MSNFQWWAMCKACKIPDNQGGLSQWQLDELLPGGKGPAAGVDFAAFLHSIPLIAAKKFPDETLERGIERLIKEYLLRYMGVPESELMQCTRQAHTRPSHPPPGCLCRESSPAISSP